MLVEDYTTLALQRFEAFMQKLATENGVYDPSFLETVKKKVHTLASDGAPSERRSIFLAAWKYFRNAGVLIRDPARATRLAIVKPLRVEEMFAPVLKDLVGPVKAERRLPKPACGGAHGIKGGGLILDITHSENGRSSLRHFKKTWKAHPGSQEDAVEVVLRQFAFAFHRMDSAADPVAKTGLLLICLLYTSPSPRD